MRTVLFFAMFLLCACGGGGSSSSPAAPPPPAANTPPSVDAGSDMEARELTSLTLNGSASDSDGTVDSLRWDQIAGPAAQLSDVNQRDLNVSLPDLECPAAFQFRLTAVDNGGEASEDVVTVSVRPNIPAFDVDAGPDRKLFAGNSISVTPDTDLLDCVTQSAQWVQTGGSTTPIDQSSGDLIVDGNGINTNYEATFWVTLTDIDGAAMSDEMTVLARAPSPIAVTQNLQADAFKLYADTDRVFAKVSSTLLDIDGLTGNVRTIAGNTVNLSDSGGQTTSFSSLRDARYDPGRELLYLAQSQLDVIDTDPDDGRTAIESILPQSSILGCCNDLAFEITLDTIYYAQSQNDQTDIYTYPRSGASNSTLLATIPNDNLGFLRTNTALYAYGGSVSSDFYVIDQTDGRWTVIVSDAYSGRTPTAPTNSDTHVYWQIDDVLYEIEEQTQTFTVVASGLLPVLELTYHDGHVYAVQQPTFASPEEVRRTNVNSGVSEIVTSLSSIDGIGFANNTLYLVAGRSSPTATDLYRVDAGTPTIVSSLPEFRLRGNNAGRTMTLVGNKFFVANDGAEFLTFDLSSLDAELLITPSPTEYVVELDGFIAFGGGRTNNGLSGFDATRTLRTTTNIFDTGRQSNTWSVVDTDDSLYWIYSEQETPGFQEIYKIGAIGKNGTGFQTLFTGSPNELRDIGLYNNRLIYSCLDDCGTPGWQLTSLALAGGVPEALGVIGENPQIVVAGNLVYIVSGILNSEVSVFNLDTLEVEPLPIRLAGRDFRVVAREDVIYVGDRDELKRYEKGAWDEVRNEQTISVADGEFPENFDVGSMVLTDTALYYRDQVLTRLQDAAP